MCGQEWVCEVVAVCVLWGWGQRRGNSVWRQVSACRWPRAECPVTAAQRPGLEASSPGKEDEVPSYPQFWGELRHGELVSPALRVQGRVACVFEGTRPPVDGFTSSSTEDSRQYLGVCVEKRKTVNALLGGFSRGVMSWTPNQEAAPGARPVSRASFCPRSAHLEPCVVDVERWL